MAESSAATAAPSLPPVTTVTTLSAEERAQILDLLFEPCDQIHTLSVELLRTTPFDAYSDLIKAVEKQMMGLASSNLHADRAWLEAILSAHPRLGAGKVDSEQSRKEQAQLNQGGATEEAEQLTALNQEYEKTFPGMIYVVFVNGRSRSLIMEDMKKRIERGDANQERMDAIKAMADIAIDRAGKMGA